MEFPKHKIYDHEPNLEKADAVAWVLTENNGGLKQFPFKFPAIAEDEVRIKIKHTGLCHSDCLHGREKWFKGVNYPFCGGHEVIGEITQVGAKVTNFKVGTIAGASPQRNFCEECDNCKQGNNNICNKFQGLYDPYFGGYATHIQLPAKMTFAIPSGMPLDKIPPLMCAGLTVFAPIQRWFKAQQAKKGGLKVGVFGIGGLGHLAVQYFAALGCEVTAFTTSTNREKELKDMGAKDISHSTDLASLGSDKVMRQYDCILNCLYIEDSNVFQAIQRTVKKAGTIIQVGLPPTDVPMQLDVMNLVFNQITLQGSIVGSYQDMVDTLEFSAKHKIYSTCEHFAFEDFPKAFDLLENGRPKFRACVNVVDWAKKNGFDK